MQENNASSHFRVRTEKNLLEGVITIGDITKSYMNLYDSSIISKACTKYANILDTLEGSMVVGDSEAYFDRGKVLIAAANPGPDGELHRNMTWSFSETAMSPSFAPLRWKQAAFIVCEGAGVSATIRKLAPRRGAVQSLRHRMTPTQQPV